MTNSGTAPFDATSGPGRDAAASDTAVRTYDKVGYAVGVSLAPAETNAFITLKIGVTTLPANYVGPANPKIAYFDVTDLPSGSAGCQNIQSAPMAGPVAGQSGVSADGQTLYCALASPTSAIGLNFAETIAGSAPNGSTVAAPTITYSSTQSAPNSSASALVNATTYGLPDLAVSAAPHWDISKQAPSGTPQFIAKSGPNGEDGWVLPYNIGIHVNGSRKGSEALAGTAANPVTFTDNFANANLPNARLVTWPMNSAYLKSFGVNTNLTPSNCGNWNSSAAGGSISFNQVYFGPYDNGAGSGAAVLAVDGVSSRGVSVGGLCSMTGTAGQTASFQLTGTDFSLTPQRISASYTYPGYPQYSGYAMSRRLVDPTNLDSATNQFWVASKLVLIWVPLTDIPTPPTPNTQLLTNTVTDFSAKSVTGQDNVEPATSGNVTCQGAAEPNDNTCTEGMTNQAGAGLNKIGTIYPYPTVPGGFTAAPCDPNVTNTCYVNQVAPTQVLAAWLMEANTGTLGFPSMQICDRLDNTRTTFFDATSVPYNATTVLDPLANPNHVPGQQYVYKDANTGIAYAYVTGSPSIAPVTFALGFDSSVAGTWSSYNTVSSEYVVPGLTGSANAAASCDAATITWYASPAAFIAAGHTLSDVTWVRALYPSGFPSGLAMQISVPLQANSTYKFGTSNNAPGSGAIAAGSTIAGQANIADRMTVNTATWQYVDTNGVAHTYKTADAVRVMQTEFAQISKTSSSNPVANSLVSSGATVTYDLTVNLTTSGSAHTTTVDVWDVLPQYVGYQSGSSTFGGAAVADPTCASSGLPTTIFASGTVPAGFTACHWTLPNQTATLISVGATAGNLPVLEFKAGVALNAPANTSLLNTSYATSTTNLFPTCSYQNAASGFVTGGGNGVCHFSNWTLRVTAPVGALVAKTIDKTTMPINSPFNYTLTYGGLGTSLSGVRLIDVLPYVGDGRTPATNFSGTVQLAGFPPNPVATNGTPATLSDPNIVILYTINTPANISTNPYAASQNLSGTGANSTTSTNWCTQAQFGSANCPASVGAVTALLIEPLGATTNQIAQNTAYALTLPMIASGNKPGDVYSNAFTFDSPDLAARLPGSQAASGKVVAPDLVIDKSVSPTQTTAGGSVTFTLVPKNDSTNPNAGPFLGGAIAIDDPMPAGFVATLPVTATGWDCSASTSTEVKCTYTGALPIASGATIGSPINIVATASLVLPDLSDTFTNTACVAASATEVDTTNNCDSAIVTVSRQPEIGSYKLVTAGPTANGDGTFNVTFKIGAKNYGPQDVTAFKLSDTLAGAAPSFGQYTAVAPSSAGTYTIAAAPICQLVTGTSSASYAANSSFTGDAANNSLLAAATTLPAATSTTSQGEVSCVLSVRFAPAAGQLHFTNSAVAGGSANGSLLIDSSYNGTDPKGGNGALPSTDPANNLPTPIDITRTVQPMASKSASPTQYLAGQATTITYKITASNTGADGANGFSVVDVPAAGITVNTWACSVTTTGSSYVGVTSACGAATGLGALNTTADLQPGAVVTYTVNATVGVSATGTQTNSVTVSAPAGSACSSSCSSTRTADVTPYPPGSLAIRKTANIASYPQGFASSIVYTLTVTNIGAGPVAGGTLIDAAPAGVTFANWACTVTSPGTGSVVVNACGAGGTGSPVSDSLTLNPGAVATYTINATINANAAGSLINTATVTTPASQCASASCTSTDSVTTLPVTGALTIAKSASTQTYNAGMVGAVTYTIVVTNPTARGVVGAAITDPEPSGVSFTAWSCAITSAGTPVVPAVANLCGSGPQGGPIVDTISLTAGAVATYTVTASVAAAAIGAVNNRAQVVAPSDQCSNSCTAASEAQLTPVFSHLTVAKSVDAKTYIPGVGSGLIYTVVVSNAGSGPVSGASLLDVAPSNVTFVSWSCTITAPGTGTSVTNACAANGSGDIADSVVLNPGAVATYTVNATIGAAASGNLLNTATVTAPAAQCDGACSSSSSATTLASPQVRITKTTPATSVTANGTIVYTVTVTNVGSVPAAGTVVADPLPDGVLSETWSCAATGGAACPAVGGSGPVSATIANLPAGGAVIYTITATTVASPPSVIINTATVSPPSGGTCLPGNTPTSCSAVASVPPVPTVAIAKSANVSSILGGGSIVYTITAMNTGAVDASNALVSDPLPDGIAGASWTCAASNGAACAALSGTGAINQTITDFPAGGKLIYTVSATAIPAPTGAIVNTAKIFPPSSGKCQPCTAQVTVAVASSGAGPSSEPVDLPALDREAVILLLLAILAGGLLQHRRVMASSIRRTSGS